MPKLNKQDRGAVKEMDAKARRRFVRTMKAAQEEVYKNTKIDRPDMGKEHAKEILGELIDWAGKVLLEGDGDFEVTLTDYGKRGSNPMGARFEVFKEKAKKGVPRKAVYSRAFRGPRLANRKAKDVARGIISNLNQLLIRR